MYSEEARKKEPKRVLSFYSGKVVDMGYVSDPKMRFHLAAMRAIDNAGKGYVIEGENVYLVSSAFRTAKIVRGEEAAQVLAQVESLLHQGASGGVSESRGARATRTSDTKPSDRWRSLHGMPQDEKTRWFRRVGDALFQDSNLSQEQVAALLDAEESELESLWKKKADVASVVRTLLQKRRRAGLGMNEARRASARSREQHSVRTRPTKHQESVGRAIENAIRRDGRFDAHFRDDPGWTTIFVDDKQSGAMVAVVIVYPRGNVQVSGPSAGEIKRIVERWKAGMGFEARTITRERATRVRAPGTRKKDERYGDWSGTRRTLTYGVMPPEDEFIEAFEEEIGDGVYEIVNDPLIGTDSFTSYELYDLVKDLAKKWNKGTSRDADQAGDTASSILSTLGFEWV
jgi:hypothetical protein